MKRKVTGMTAVLAAGVMLLTGCEMLEQNTWQPQGPDAVSVAEDGSVTETVRDTLDAAYYDATELENMIHAEVAEYNVSHGENSVVVDQLEFEENQVSLTMKYATARDYAGFNNTEFYYGTVIGAQLEGYLFDVPFRRVSDGVFHGAAVTGTEVIKEMDKQVLILRAPAEVQVCGDVLFTSSNAEMLAADVVNATGNQLEDDAGLVLPSSAVYRGREATFAEKTAASRVYIIFDDI